ncbi:MAG: phage terminase large subunit, partial [Oscillospiraceae bacterium]|nr:phage terminase large subunit [Oscillospiraceae bacterium]
MELKLRVTERQMQFLNAGADEVLFGGAAGGGKSYGQVVDGLLYGLAHPRSKQLVLRRTLGELERSLVRTAEEVVPPALGRYHRQSHTLTLTNGSLIDFGYCAAEGDVRQYQSAEYDVIRFDELTHFTEYQYTYLLSRLRGTNGYPKQMKSTTNPGGVGHEFVKARFIDSGAPPGTPFERNGRTRLYIPAGVRDNVFLMRAD